MGSTTIEWAHYTFNPWRGCEKVSPACTNCYAEVWAKRTGKKIWGRDALREIGSPSYWLQPNKWNDEAKRAGERRRVFCASLADVFEGRGDLDNHRARLWDVIEATPHLDWLLLTKRPENLTAMLPNVWRGSPRTNVWLGTTVENQQCARVRIPALLAVRAAVHFLSIEPLLGPVALEDAIPCGMYCDSEVGHVDHGPNGHMGCIDWVIVGGESGGKARPFSIPDARSIIVDCKVNHVPVFVKQLGRRPRLGYYDDFRDVWMDTFHEEWPDPIDWSIDRDGQPPLDAVVELPLNDKKGGDPDEWPGDLCIRELPNR